MRESEIKPVSWKWQDETVKLNPCQYEKAMQRGVNGYKVRALYDQSSIDALSSQIRELKTMLSIAEFQRKEMQAERDGYASAADFLELEMAKFQIAADEARAERDADVADAERYRWLRKHLVNWCPDYDKESLIWHAREALDAEIDAARAEGK